jgi:hypothetical protein
MKKIIFAVLFCALNVGFVAAQIGVNFGYSNASIKDEIKGTYSGFNAGVSYDLSISEDWTMLTGLSYSHLSKTFTEKLPIGSFKEKTYTFQHLEIPIQPAYNMQLMDNFKIFVFAGPKLVLNVAGEKTEQYGGKTITNLYGKDQDRSRFNVKLGFGFAAQYTQFRLKMGYDWGLLNQYTGIVKDTKYKMSEFYITAGYIINLK